jgi:hypothetical protein
MARSLCSCGTQILWKADEPESDEWYLIAAAGLPDDMGQLLSAAQQAAFCSHCGHFWVAWDGGAEISEYAPVDHTIRPRHSP